MRKTVLLTAILALATTASAEAPRQTRSNQEIFRNLVGRFGRGQTFEADGVSDEGRDCGAKIIPSQRETGKFDLHYEAHDEQSSQSGSVTGDDRILTEHNGGFEHWQTWRQSAQGWTSKANDFDPNDPHTTINWRIELEPTGELIYIKYGSSPDPRFGFSCRFRAPPVS